MTEQFDHSAFLRHAQERALQLADEGDLRGAIDSMVSDLSHDESRPQEQKQMIGMMGISLRAQEHLSRKDVLDFIYGFPDGFQRPAEEVQTLDSLETNERARAEQSIASIREKLDTLEQLEKSGKVTPGALKKIGEKLGAFFAFFGEMASYAENSKSDGQIAKTVLAGSPFITLELLAMTIVAMQYHNDSMNEVTEKIWQFFHDIMAYGTHDPAPMSIVKQVGVSLGMTVGPIVVGRACQKIIALAYDATHKEQQRV